MNTQPPRFQFEQATAQDSDEILTILEDAPFKGNISLLYTRRPDAYWSFTQEGEEVNIIVARDTKHDNIAGLGACALRTLFVNGIPARVGYLFGLRVARAYLKKFPILHRGYAYLRALHQTKKVACYITTILEENLSAQALLEKRRAFMPTYHPFGKYEIFALTTGRTRESRSSRLASYSFRRATISDLPALITFLHEQGQQFQFFPILTESTLRSGIFPGLRVENFWVMQNTEGEFLATGALWDQRSYKQYVLQGYGGYFKWLYPFAKLLPLFRLSGPACSGQHLSVLHPVLLGGQRSRPRKYFPCFLSKSPARLPLFLSCSLVCMNPILCVRFCKNARTSATEATCISSSGKNNKNLSTILDRTSCPISSAACYNIAILNWL